MKIDNKTIGLIVAVILIAAVIFFLFSTREQRPEGTGLIDDQTPNQAPDEVELEIGSQIGQLAPDFALEDSDGNIVKLSDFRGDKSVLINVWAAWCPFCVDEIPDIELAAQKYNDDLVVLFINRGESKSVAFDYLATGLREPIEIKSPILFDPAEDVYRGYNSFGMPVSFFIDKDGIIRDKKSGFMIPTERIENLLSFS